MVDLQAHAAKIRYMQKCVAAALRHLRKAKALLEAAKGGTV